MHLNGEISARNRTSPYKGGMFAAYPGDIVFSRIDARSGAIGVLQENIAKAVVTSEFPVFVPASEHLEGEFVKLVLRTGNFLTALRAKASGTSGRKRITAEAFVDLHIPLPPLDEQRAMIAAALACRPRVLIADEPTTALDVTVQAQILRLLLDLRDRRGLAIILVTHDLGVVAQACDAIAVMYGGQIVERAAKAELLRRPLHPYSRGLIASQPGSAEPLKELPTIPGQPPAIAAMPSGCRFHPRCSLAEEACRHEPPVLTAAAHAHETACRRWTALVEAA